MSTFVRKAGLAGSMPGFVACGGRDDAKEDFETAAKSPKDYLPMLLVDAEGPATAKDPW